MLNENELQGFWGNEDWTMSLKNNQVEICWLKINQKANGTWLLRGNVLRLMYTFSTSIEKFTWEGEILDFNTKSIKIRDISNEFNKIDILENKSQKSKLKEVVDEHKEDVMQAYLISLTIAILVGPLIRYLLNPSIPTWVICIFVFIASLYFVKRYQ